MAKKISSTYLIVRVDFEHEDDIKGEDLDDLKFTIEAELDYEFSFKDEYAEIVETEICGRSQEM